MCVVLLVRSTERATVFFATTMAGKDAARTTIWVIWRLDVADKDKRMVLNQVATPAMKPSSDLAFQLDEHASRELHRISEETKVSPEELVGIALRFMIMTADAHRHNRRVLVTTPSGYPISELTIPRP